MSGGYEDDYDLGEEILYTGEGSNDPATGKQMGHQTWKSPGNAGLRTSQKDKKDVRVIRGANHNSRFSPKSGYKFDGLYRVENSEMILGKAGFKICRFTLKKISAELGTSQEIKEGNLVLLKSEGKPEKWFSIGAEAPNAQKIRSESKMAQLLLGKTVGDKLNFGPGFLIIEIRRYLG